MDELNSAAKTKAAKVVRAQVGDRQRLKTEGGKPRWDCQKRRKLRLEQIVDGLLTL